MKQILCLSIGMFAVVATIAFAADFERRMIGLCVFATVMMVVGLTLYNYNRILCRVIAMWMAIARNLAKTPEDDAMITRAEHAMEDGMINDNIDQ